MQNVTCDITTNDTTTNNINCVTNQCDSTNNKNANVIVEIKINKKHNSVITIYNRYITHKKIDFKFT